MHYELHAELHSVNSYIACKHITAGIKSKRHLPSETVSNGKDAVIPNSEM